MITISFHTVNLPKITEKKDMKKDLYSHLKKLPYLDTSISFFSAHKQHVPHG